MDRERISRALERIEAATNRIEKFAARPRSPASDGGPELADKYARLRAETSKALAELDGLIEGIEG